MPARPHCLGSMHSSPQCTPRQRFPLKCESPQLARKARNSALLPPAHRGGSYNVRLPPVRRWANGGQSPRASMRSSPIARRADPQGSYATCSARPARPLLRRHTARTAGARVASVPDEPARPLNSQAHPLRAGVQAPRERRSAPQCGLVATHRRKCRRGDVFVWPYLRHGAIEVGHMRWGAPPPPRILRRHHDGSRRRRT
jgi:hypothetical protein